MSKATQQLLFDSLQDEIKKVQKKCFIFDDSEPIEESLDLTNSILCKIKDYEIDVIAAALGLKLATRLSRFAESIDLEHPSLKDLFKGQLIFGDFSAQCCGLLNVASFSKENEPLIFSRIKRILSRGKTYREIEKSIDDPERNQLHVRFIKDREVRERVRATKRMQTINVGIIEKKGHDIWSSHQSTFENYARNTDVWQKEIEEAKTELERFKKLGCKDLANGIEADIKNFQSQLQETYFGFNRIPMTHAAVILAKVHGYEIKHMDYREKYKILIPRIFFRKFSNFCVDDISRDQDYSWFEYEPRSYTISELKENDGGVSNDMEKFIDYLENFPAVGGKPIFDHFRILVPGVQYPLGGWGHSSYVNEKGVKISASVDKVKVEVDMMLIKNGIYRPILLGEKDEHCYFISYWL